MTPLPFAESFRPSPSQLTPDAAISITLIEITGGASRHLADTLAVEEPLAIQLCFGPLQNRRRTTLSITMRTPGHDEDLVAGFLFVEGIVTDPVQILRIEPARSEQAVRIDLHPNLTVELARLDRRGYTSSSCGVCGKTSIDAVEATCDGPRPGGKPIPTAVIHSLPASLRESQPIFSDTGGLHAAALFDATGKLLAVREDVGRHNAIDKLIGTEFLAGRVPLENRILFVSGRAGFELIQKAAVAGVAIFAAVGAPSSLAVSLAQRLGMTLLGFVRNGRFNIYSGAERIEITKVD